MRRYTLGSLLILLLLGSWVFAVVYLLEYDLPNAAWGALLLPFLISTVLIFLLRELIPRHKLHAIRELAASIRDGIEKSLTAIDVPDAPEEIIPLIESINRLVAFYEDRYRQERDFSANASHELRTPLAGIRLQTEIAMKTQSPEQREKALHNILYSVNRSTRLVEQLLILSRLTADRVDLEMEVLCLGRVVAQVVAELNDIALQKNITLNFAPWDETRINGSEEVLSILVHNVVRNAISYTQEGGNIWVAVFALNESAVLTVTDNGPGIPEDKRQLVLRRFEKAARNSKGTGLGLSIVKRIAILHNAGLALEDGENGIGLNVRVTFPISNIPAE
jgi:two-component system sensor histidine kinase QseC